MLLGHVLAFCFILYRYFVMIDRTGLDKISFFSTVISYVTTTEHIWNRPHFLITHHLYRPLTIQRCVRRATCFGRTVYALAF